MRSRSVDPNRAPSGIARERTRPTMAGEEVRGKGRDMPDQYGGRDETCPLCTGGRGRGGDTDLEANAERHAAMNGLMMNGFMAGRRGKKTGRPWHADRAGWAQALVVSKADGRVTAVLARPARAGSGRIRPVQITPSQISDAGRGPRRSTCSLDSSSEACLDSSWRRQPRFRSAHPQGLQRSL